MKARSIAVVAVLVALLTIHGCLWFPIARATEPNPFLLLVAPFAILVAVFPLAALCSRSWRSALLAVLLPPLISFGGCWTAVELGAARVRQACARFVASPAPPTQLIEDLRPHLPEGPFECRIVDNDWGAWQVDVLSEGQVIARMSIDPLADEGMRVDRVSLRRRAE